MAGTMTPTPVSELELPTVLELDPSTDPLEAVESTRELAADHWLARGLIGYSLLRYDDANAVLRDRRWHSAVARLTELSGITDPEFVENRRSSILSVEGDVHQRLRRLVAKAFSPRAADRLRPVMRDVLNGLVDEVCEAGHCDFVTDICDPYPIPIICELLGAPKQDWQLFSRWAEDVLRIFNGTVNEELEVIKQAQRELDAYTVELIAARRDDPRDDLITDLIAAEEEGDRLSTEELVMMVNAVIVGGTDTTRNQLGLAMALFAQHPDQWRMLRDDPSLAPQAVEEVMRYLGAVRGTGRFASEDIVYRDVLFPAGTFVFPSIAVANRDPDKFADPTRFDIMREPVVGTPQLTFGSGIHYCLGASLARAELQEAFVLLARRMPDVELDGPVQWKPLTVGIFGAERLPLRFTPTPRAS